MVARVVLAVALVCCVAAPARAQTPAQADALRDGNDAAAAGDWEKVAQLVSPLLAGRLPQKDLAEAHRLAGLAAYFRGRTDEADHHFFQYLLLELDGRLDPALYPPDALAFFERVKLGHQRELRAKRPKQKRYWLLNLIPPGGQIQNGDRAKGYVVGGLMVAFAVGNVASYLVLRSWCNEVSGSRGSSVTCDDDKDHLRAAGQLRTVNLVTGAGLILTYAYGVWDGVRGYRRRSRETMQPYVATSPSGDALFGIAGRF
ncbi:MAG: hypothetical protein KF773_41430 [Deltaproteobacteria bacterium]|nr:hypothetical protein [Deltaproteobacteria bacterium]MCW5807747.1 hypothetical protein [Deltaproteobacteria bacterium]